MIAQREILHRSSVCVIASTRQFSNTNTNTNTNQQPPNSTNATTSTMKLYYRLAFRDSESLLINSAQVISMPPPTAIGELLTNLKDDLKDPTLPQYQKNLRACIVVSENDSFTKTSFKQCCCPTMLPPTDSCFFFLFSVSFSLSLSHHINTLQENGIEYCYLSNNVPIPLTTEQCW